MKPFWNKDRESEETFKKINEKGIAKAEKKLGVILPDTYKKLILEQNGGYTLHNAFPTDQPNGWAEDHVSFDHLRGIAKDEGIMDSDYLIEEWELPEGLVLICGDGHTWIALDYRETKEHPPVHYFDLEDETDFKLADSFDELLAGHYTAEDSEEDGMSDEEWQAEYEKQNKPLSKEEVKDIFLTKDPEQLSKIANFQVEQIDDIKWIFSEVETYMDTLQNEEMLTTAGWAINTIFIMNDEMIKQHADVVEHARRFAKQLSQSEIDEMHNIAINISIAFEFDLEE
ncbi:SMI1/KNR4 family protein [Bacillus pumilus]|uniref:SMI1/KNR4 family protein n=1 Tax=Bacillus pumilus TaxID=1408 RepID=UPI00017A5D76|nr:SMI1/KNR4 family protein [Bacillus pumilus]EDW21735.1 SMI1 / KNR4 family [Bacillus pumilus ATCC 7061]MCR4355109.1 SMI1/KNR4 family protein [Bacillus pumilus]MCY7505677.1 SMI1/KNR4 family protein [Bacillus pumilus]MDR4271374.1 SMI1/KNR4 family protein [Bacillus pumilus]MED4628894.1 SMI1/KNR4 family protein [Bacillus pumilus]